MTHEEKSCLNYNCNITPINEASNSMTNCNQCENAQVNNNSTINWLYDSGAVKHIANNINILNNYNKQKVSLRCANESLYDFEGYCECHKY